MTDEQAFLDALKANPADDTTRLVYADWLDDRGEAAKAEYLRRVVDLVVFPPGRREYTEAAGELVAASLRIGGGWRAVAGARYDLTLVGYPPDRKIHAIKVIREQTGFGLAEAKAIAESVPIALFSWRPFEDLFPRQLAFVGPWALGSPPPAEGPVIHPSAWPRAAGPDTVFDIVLVRTEVDEAAPGLTPPWRLGELARGLARVLGTDFGTASQRVRQLPLTLRSGVPPAAVSSTVRELLMALNVYRSIPPGGIQIVPRSRS